MSPSSLRRALPIVTALAIGVVALNALAWGYGARPLATLVAAAAGTWGTPYGIGQVLFKATPLLFAGLAVDLALRAGLFNIGAEGQLVLASVAAAWVGAALPPGTPALVALPLTLAAAALTGALWAAVPGLLRAYRGAHEVIATILLNRVAFALASWGLGAGLALPGTVRTANVAPGARLPALGRWVAAWDGSAVSLAIVLGVAVALAATTWLRRARIGREIGSIGLGPRACEAEGIPVKRRLVLAMVLSGALAGLGASGTVLGYKGYYESGLGAGAGFAGIAVALLGRRSAIGLVLAAVLFGTLDQAGLAINATVPREAMNILLAVVMVALSAAERVATDAAPPEAAR